MESVPVPAALQADLRAYQEDGFHWMARLAAFLDITGELIENNHRALVFSQFVSHLAIVRQALDKQNIKYQYLDGSSTLGGIPPLKTRLPIVRIASVNIAR